MFQFDEAFVTALNRLTERERKDTLLVAMEVQHDRRRGGLHVEPLHNGHDRTLWSARVNDDIRIILLKETEALIPVYVGHHEEAYRWASTRRTMRDTATGSVTILHQVAVEMGAFPISRSAPPGKFDNYEDTYLLTLGLPAALLPALRHVRSDDDLLNLALDLPTEVSDRLLRLAEGRLVAPPLPPAPPDIETPPDSVTAPEPAPVVAERTGEREAEAREPLRLHNVDDDDLRRMLDAPMESWIAFLHPSQRGVATRLFSGPAKITGGAGTGKSVVAMHRARHLAAQGRRVLLASFTNNARAILEQGVDRLCDGEVRERIIVRTVHALACDLIHQREVVNPPEDGLVDRLIAEHGVSLGIDIEVLQAEWRHVIQALGITQWEGYRDAQRTGRGTRLSTADRERIWETVIVKVDAALKARGVTDWPDICCWARELILTGRVLNPVDAVIVDETQDLGPQELRFLAALAGDGPDCLTLVGDAGQRIYPNRTSLRELGIDVRGRTRTLSLNYRTTEQIYRFAEAILGNEVDDMEGGTERRRTTYSLFAGPEPALCGYRTPTEQYAAVAECIARQCAAGLPPGEIAILAQGRYSLTGAATALTQAGIACQILGREHVIAPDHVTLATIHRAKGLEFKAVIVIGASDDAVQRHLPSDADEQRMTLEQERNLLYVAVTRARDELTVCWTGKPSRFLARVLPAAV
jgi:hypothetical protein